jgi:hypothetical protein
MSEKSKRVKQFAAKSARPQAERIGKSASSYTKIDGMPILRLNNPDVFELWLTTGTVYFAKTYSKLGCFFPNGGKQVPPMPTMPTVVAFVPPAVAAGAAADVTAADVPDDSSVSSTSSSSSESVGSDGDSDDGTAVAYTPELAVVIYTDKLKRRNRIADKERETRPAMYADLRANLSLESIEKLSIEPTYLKVVEKRDPYGLMKLILKVHGGAKTGWKVTDGLVAKRSVFGCVQSSGENLLTFKNRFIAVAATTTEFTPQELAVVFIDNLNASNARYKSDKATIIATAATDAIATALYPQSMEQAHREASLYQSTVKAAKVPVLTTIIIKDKGRKETPWRDNGQGQRWRQEQPEVRTAHH